MNVTNKSKRIKNKLPSLEDTNLQVGMVAEETIYARCDVVKHG